MSIYRDHDSPLPVHLVPNFKAFIGSYLNTKSNKFLIHMQHKGFTIIICTVVYVGLCYSVFNSWANKQRNTQKTKNKSFIANITDKWRVGPTPVSACAQSTCEETSYICALPRLCVTDVTACVFVFKRADVARVHCRMTMHLFADSRGYGGLWLSFGVFAPRLSGVSGWGRWRRRARGCDKHQLLRICSECWFTKQKSACAYACFYCFEVVLWRIYSLPIT